MLRHLQKSLLINTFTLVLSANKGVFDDFKLGCKGRKKYFVNDDFIDEL